MNLPKRIIDQVEFALSEGKVVKAFKTRRSKELQYDTESIYRQFGKGSYLSKVNLLSHIETGKEKPKSRFYAELSLAYTIALGVNRIAPFQSLNDTKIKVRNELRAIRKNVDLTYKSIKNSGGDPFSNDEYLDEVKKYQNKFSDFYNEELHPEKVIKDQQDLQQKMIDECLDSAVSLERMDINTRNRLRAITPEFVQQVNSGRQYRDIINPARIERHKQALYDEMLMDVYNSSRSNLSALGKEMFRHHISEIQSYGDGLYYDPRSKKKKRLDFDLNLSQFESNAYINEGDGDLKPVVPNLNTGSKAPKWGFALSVREFESGGVCLVSNFSLVGRRNETFSIGPKFSTWLSRLPVNEKAVANGQTIEEIEQANLIEKQKREEKIRARDLEYQIQREASEAEYKKVIQERFDRVNKNIDINDDEPNLTHESIANTYVENKHLSKLLDYTELHGLIRKTQFRDVPCVSIQMGPSPDETVGLQFLANSGLSWNEENDMPTNKLFEVGIDDMKRNFVQLGEVTPNSLIIVQEGFATAGSTYIAAKEKNSML